MRNDEAKNITPVILGGQDDVRCLIENFHFNDMTTENIIAGAEQFKIEEFMKN